MNIKLVSLQEYEKDAFIRNIQIAFKKAVVEQFGDFEDEIIPRDHVIRSFDAEGGRKLQHRDGWQSSWWYRSYDTSRHKP